MNGTLEHNNSYSKLYRKWLNMKARCHYTKGIYYKNYGARGITVCKEWDESFKIFEQWALESGYDAKLELDRINNDGNYEPANCRFITGTENLKNRRRSKNEIIVTRDGVSKNLEQWAKFLGINGTAFYDRYKRGDRGEKLMRKVNPAYALGKKKAAAK